MHKETQDITKLILDAAAKAREEAPETEPMVQRKMSWPRECTVGPGLEGAIACDTKISYINGTTGKLLYQGCDIFDLCAYCSFEEVSHLLLFGNLPNKKQLATFQCAVSRTGVGHCANLAHSQTQ